MTPEQMAARLNYIAQNYFDESLKDVQQDLMLISNAIVQMNLELQELRK